MLLALKRVPPRFLASIAQGASGDVFVHFSLWSEKVSGYDAFLFLLASYIYFIYIFTQFILYLFLFLFVLESAHR